ncbi:MAG: DNA repair protein RecO [Pseudomonadales bacterium]|nr:DNA repair protein RecO [Pseudomonadales bacterium]
MPDLAFVLHQRPYGESGALLDLLTVAEGRVVVVARGVRGRRRRMDVRLFTPLQVAYAGRRDLKTLTQAEGGGEPVVLLGRQLYLGFYLNELACRLLPRDWPVPALFLEYQQALHDVTSVDTAVMETALRRYERCMLEMCGFDHLFAVEVEHGEPLEPEASYALDPERGFLRAHSGYLGAHLLAMDRADYGDPEVRLGAKHIFRQWLHVQLQGRPLRSRELFKQEVK